jgi:hypothetical protein
MEALSKKIQLKLSINLIPDKDIIHDILELAYFQTAEENFD